jgi:hypothetical protein
MDLEIIRNTRNEQYESNYVTHQMFDKSLGHFEYGVSCALATA